jgi:hypothetical protein
MEMGRFAGSSRDFVHVEIDGGNPHRQAGETGLLLGFGQRDDGEVAVPIGVTAGLQPSVELDVVKDQGRPPGGVDDGGRAGQMTGQARSVESIRVATTELQNPLPEVFLLGTNEFGRSDLLDGEGETGLHVGKLARRDHLSRDRSVVRA